MNYTTNYQLNQWVKDDQVRMEDFNADNAKIDAAIKAVADSKVDTSALEALSDRVEQVALSVPRIVFGSYTGDGAPSKDIVLGFQPKAVVLFRQNGYTSFYSGNYFISGGLAFPGHPINNPTGVGMEIIENGFRAYYNSSYHIRCNEKETYHYIAFA